MYVLNGYLAEENKLSTKLYTLTDIHIADLQLHVIKPVHVLQLRQANEHSQVYRTSSTDILKLHNLVENVQEITRFRRYCIYILV